ncbi:hypothetical protein D9M70_624440 [compost metagenome]
MQLVGADALLAGSDKVDALQPQAQRDVARFKYGPDLDGERLAAVIALVGSDAGRGSAHQLVPLSAATVRAHRSVGPDARLHESIGCFFIVKVGLRKVRHGGS